MCISDLGCASIGRGSVTTQNHVMDNSREDARLGPHLPEDDVRCDG
jgi:hypothetical protein